MLASSANAGSSPPPRPPYQPLVIVLAAAAAGILADRFLPLSLGIWWTLAMGGFGLWLLLAFLGGQSHFRGGNRVGMAVQLPSQQYREGKVLHAAKIGTVPLLLAVAATAGAWHHCRWNLFATDDLGRFARHKAEPTCVEAVAVGSPRAIPAPAPDPMRMMPSKASSRLMVDLVGLRNGSTWQPVSGRAILLVQGPPPPIGSGDRLRCFGKLAAPALPENPGSFDRSAYLRVDRVRSQLQAEVPECLSVIETGTPWSLSRLLDRVRAHGNQVLRECLNPAQAELAAAVLLGLREEIDAERNEAFLTTGTVHILVIAGLHMGILAWAMFWLMRYTFLPRSLALAAIALLTLLYALMVDAQPSVVRATVLVLIVCGSMFFGRRGFGMNSLAAAALVVLAMNPAQMFQVGAQLSFLCVAGLIWFAPRRPHWDDKEKAKRILNRMVEENLGFLPRMLRKFLRSVIGMFLAGVLLWSIALPLVMARFHVFSLAGLVMNALLWIPMTVSVLSGFGVMVFGSIWSPLGHLCGWACDWNFWLLESCIDTAHRIPGSHFWVPGPADWWLWGFYGGLGLAAAFPQIRPPRRWLVGLLALWIAVGFTVAAWRHDRNRLDCTFLSMGHGCAVFMELPSGQKILYDAGKLGISKIGERTIAEFLWSRGVTHLDAVVLSHPDTDHYNALPGLLEKFSVGAVYVSPVMFEKDNEGVAALRSAIERHCVPVREVRGGDCLRTGEGCSVEVLHPPRRGVLGSDNANSLVLAVDYRGHEILLPGDLESPGLDDLLAEEPRRCEVLLAPHHGSSRSNSPGLAKWCKPHWVVISGDGRWSRSEVEAPYCAVGGRVLHTHDGGAIQVQINADGVQVSPYVKSQR